MRKAVDILIIAVIVWALQYTVQPIFADITGRTTAGRSGFAQDMRIRHLENNARSRFTPLTTTDADSATVAEYAKPGDFWIHHDPSTDRYSLIFMFDDAVKSFTTSTAHLYRLLTNTSFTSIQVSGNGEFNTLDVDGAVNGDGTASFGATTVASLSSSGYITTSGYFTTTGYAEIDSTLDVGDKVTIDSLLTASDGVVTKYGVDGSNDTISQTLLDDTFGDSRPNGYVAVFRQPGQNYNMIVYYCNSQWYYLSGTLAP